MVSLWKVSRIPLLLIVLWCALLFLLYQWTVDRESEYTHELAMMHIKTLFTNLVNVRAWNAANGGVWVEESENCPANPWLSEEMRTMLAADGTTLVRVNPAYMTRQIAERISSPLAGFRIVGNNPMRPENRANAWESEALRSFEAGVQECFVENDAASGVDYRYIAPLLADESCLHCHVASRVGDVLGGISVTMSADSLLKASAGRNRNTAMAFFCIGLIGIVGIGGATLQINRKKELAEVANRAKSAFLANMSHDMRTPLSGIIGLTEMLEKETPDRRHRYLLTQLGQASENLLHTVDDIMHYSLLEAEGRPLEVRAFCLQDEMQNCVDMFGPACRSRGLGLRLILENNVPQWVLGDSFRLHQAISNLLGNAVKFTREGEVLLRVEVLKMHETSDGSLCDLLFHVQDTGPGIPPDEQERIFENFEQGSQVHAVDDRPGVGLGLAIARNIARRLGGDLTLRSRPGSGSIFTMQASFRICTPSVGGKNAIAAVSGGKEISAACGRCPGQHSDRCRLREDTGEGCLAPLPEDRISSGAHGLKEGRAAGESVEAFAERTDFDETGNEAEVNEVRAEGSVTSEIQLLLVEDTPISALYLHEILTEAGYTVHVANSGADAFFLLRRVRPQIVMLDIRLPDISGLDIAEQIRAGNTGVSADLPVILLTASTSSEDENRIERLQVAARFIKPVNRVVLLDTLRELVVSSGVLQKTVAGAGSVETMTAVTVFDRQAALDLLESEDRLRRMSLLFLAEAEQDAQNLLDLAENAVGEEERKTLRHKAHSLKNNAAALCLPRLTLAAKALEAAAREPSTSAQELLVLTKLACASLREASSLLQNLFGNTPQAETMETPHGQNSGC